MAIRHVVTGGYGNGTFTGSIGLVVTRGYTASSVAQAEPAKLFYRLSGPNTKRGTLDGPETTRHQLSGTNTNRQVLNG